MTTTNKIYNCAPERVENFTHKIEINSTVLDVGCGSGLLGEQLYIEKKCQCIGIDYSKESLEIAKSKEAYSKLIQIDLNTLSNELDEFTGFFNYIIIGDVLEHLTNPRNVLLNLKKLLKPAGKFFIVVPNIAHGSIKLKLLKNLFDYTQFGILDNTHITHFTLKNLVEMLNNTDIKINKLDRIYLDINSSEQKINMSDYPIHIKNYVSKDLESFVYQYFIEASLHENENIKQNNEIFLKPNKEDFKKLKAYIKLNRGNLKKRITRSIERFIKKILLLKSSNN